MQRVADVPSKTSAPHDPQLIAGKIHTMLRTIFGKQATIRPSAVLLALICASALPATLAAQTTVLEGTGFSLYVNEKEMILAHPGDQAMANYAQWDTPYQRLLDRNMPFLMLQNEESSSLPITELRLSIGDKLFNFGNTASMFHGLYTMVGRTNPDAVVNSHVEDAGNELVVNFGSQGILPGELVCFRINIDVDANHPEIFPYPDFRTVLFDKNGINVYDGNLKKFSDEDNATALVTFGSGESKFEAGPVAFPDEIVNGAEDLFTNRALRPYGIMENASTFVVSAKIIEEDVVPEPSGIVIGLMGCLGGAMWAMRRRSCKASANGNAA